MGGVCLMAGRSAGGVVLQQLGVAQRCLSASVTWDYSTKRLQNFHVTSLMPGGEVPKQQSQAKVANQTRLALMHMLCASTSAALVEKVEMVCRCCSSKIQQAPTAAKSRTILANIWERHAGFNVPIIQTHHSHGLLQLKCEVFFSL